MTDIIRPIVNLNGTDRADLVQQRRDAVDGCRDLMRALSQMTPNGRDYIGQPDALRRDREIHYARFAQIDALRSALTDEAIAILNGENA